MAVDRLEEGADPKVVFFDITGTINDPAIVRLLAVMDYLFVPISTDTADMKSFYPLRQPCGEPDGYNRADKD